MIARMKKEGRDEWPGFEMIVMQGRDYRVIIRAEFPLPLALGIDRDGIRAALMSGAAHAVATVEAERE